MVKSKARAKTMGATCLNNIFSVLILNINLATWITCMYNHYRSFVRTYCIYPIYCSFALNCNQANQTEIKLYNSKTLNCLHAYLNWGWKFNYSFTSNERSTKQHPRKVIPRAKGTHQNNINIHIYDFVYDILKVPNPTKKTNIWHVYQWLKSV